jgi:hypothetical protein
MKTVEEKKGRFNTTKKKKRKKKEKKKVGKKITGKGHKNSSNYRYGIHKASH